MEALKEDVVHPENQPKDSHVMWKVIIIGACSMLLFLAVHQVREASPIPTEPFQHPPKMSPAQNPPQPPKRAPGASAG